MESSNINDHQCLDGCDCTFSREYEIENLNLNTNASLPALYYFSNCTIGDDIPGICDLKPVRNIMRCRIKKLRLDRAVLEDENQLLKDELKKFEKKTIRCEQIIEELLDKIKDLQDTLNERDLYENSRTDVQMMQDEMRQLREHFFLENKKLKDTITELSTKLIEAEEESSSAGVNRLRAEIKELRKRSSEKVIGDEIHPVKFTSEIPIETETMASKKGDDYLGMEQEAVVNRPLIVTDNSKEEYREEFNERIKKTTVKKNSSKVTTADKSDKIFETSEITEKKVIQEEYVLTEDLSKFEKCQEEFEKLRNDYLRVENLLKKSLSTSEYKADDIQEVTRLESKSQNGSKITDPSNSKESKSVQVDFTSVEQSKNQDIDEINSPSSHMTLLDSKEEDITVRQSHTRIQEIRRFKSKLEDDSTTIESSSSKKIKTVQVDKSVEQPKSQDADKINFSEKLEDSKEDNIKGSQSHTDIQEVTRLESKLEDGSTTIDPSSSTKLKIAQVNYKSVEQPSDQDANEINFSKKLEDSKEDNIKGSQSHADIQEVTRLESELEDGSTTIDPSSSTKLKIAQVNYTSVEQPSDQDADEINFSIKSIDSKEENITVRQSHTHIQDITRIESKLEDDSKIIDSPSSTKLKTAQFDYESAEQPRDQHVDEIDFSAKLSDSNDDDIKGPQSHTDVQEITRIESKLEVTRKINDPSSSKTLKTAQVDDASVEQSKDQDIDKIYSSDKLLGSEEENVRGTQSHTNIQEITQLESELEVTSKTIDQSSSKILNSVKVDYTAVEQARDQDVDKFNFPEKLLDSEEGNVEGVQGHTDIPEITGLESKLEDDSKTIDPSSSNKLKSLQDDYTSVEQSKGQDIDKIKFSVKWSNDKEEITEGPQSHTDIQKITQLESELEDGITTIDSLSGKKLQNEQVDYQSVEQSESQDVHKINFSVKLLDSKEDTKGHTENMAKDRNNDMAEKRMKISQHKSSDKVFSVDRPSVSDELIKAIDLLGLQMEQQIHDMENIEKDDNNDMAEKKPRIVRHKNNDDVFSIDQQSVSDELIKAIDLLGLQMEQQIRGVQRIQENLNYLRNHVWPDFTLHLTSDDEIVFNSSDPLVRNIFQQSHNLTMNVINAEKELADLGEVWKSCWEENQKLRKLVEDSGDANVPGTTKFPGENIEGVFDLENWLKSLTLTQLAALHDCICAATSNLVVNDSTMTEVNNTSVLLKDHNHDGLQCSYDKLNKRIAALQRQIGEKQMQTGTKVMKLRRILHREQRELMKISGLMNQEKCRNFALYHITKDSPCFVNKCTAKCAENIKFIPVIKCKKKQNL